MNTPNLNFDISQTTPVSCEKCGDIYFEQALHIRKVSGLLTGTGQTSYLPIPVFACKSCGHVNTEFLPKEVKDLGGDESSTD
jgi:uncharacterized Zn finger protein